MLIIALYDDCSIRVFKSFYNSVAIGKFSSFFPVRGSVYSLLAASLNNWPNSSKLAAASQ